MLESNDQLSFYATGETNNNWYRNFGILKIDRKYIVSARLDDGRKVKLISLILTLLVTARLALVSELRSSLTMALRIRFHFRVVEMMKKSKCGVRLENRVEIFEPKEIFAILLCRFLFF
jgi:hypothetical protein